MCFALNGAGEQLQGGVCGGACAVNMHATIRGVVGWQSGCCHKDVVSRSGSSRQSGRSVLAAVVSHHACACAPVSMSRASCACLLHILWRIVVNTAQVSQVREGLCGLLPLLLPQCVLWHCMHRCYAMYLFTKVAGLTECLQDAQT